MQERKKNYKKGILRFKTERRWRKRGVKVGGGRWKVGGGTRIKDKG